MLNSFIETMGENMISLNGHPTERLAIILMCILKG